MEIAQLQSFVDRLRLETIGEPIWNAEQQVFEYADRTIPVVAILKLLRAAQGLVSMEVLRQAGLFIDFGATIRMVNDCVEEVYFLLETYPGEPSASVTKFVTGFFEHTIDNYLEAESEPVPRNKIRNAVVRVLKGGAQDEATRALTERIYKTFCGYVHANFAHIMEIYGGNQWGFNLAGVPSVQQREMRREHTSLATNSIAFATAFAARKLNRDALHAEISQAVG